MHDLCPLLRAASRRRAVNPRAPDASGLAVARRILPAARRGQTRRWLVLAAALMATCGAAAADTRPRVEVRFRLVESGFRDAFPSEAELHRFEGETARAMEAVFANRIGFLRFGPGTNAQVLNVDLDREPVGDPSTQLVPTRFVFELRTVSDTVARLEWPFRTAEAYTRSVVPGRFHSEITNSLAARLAVDQVGAIQSLFSHIPVAREVYLVGTPPDMQCLLPFSYADIEANAQAGFEFETARPGPVAEIPQHHGARGLLPLAGGAPNAPAPFASGIPAQEDSSSVRMDRNKVRFESTPFHKLGITNGPVSGKGLFVTDYVRVPPLPPAPNSPTSFSPP